MRRPTVPAAVAVVLAVAAAAGVWLFQGRGEIKTFLVASELGDCSGAFFVTKCVRIRESPDHPWRGIDEGIDGFDFEAGFTYELKVKVTDIADPPADASSVRYELVEVVRKTPAPASQAELVLRISTERSVPPESRFSMLPEVSLYRDGTLIVTDPVTGSPFVPHLSDVETAAVVASAAAAGVRDEPPDVGHPWPAWA